jgi:hypothetical protein
MTDLRKNLIALWDSNTTENVNLAITLVPSVPDFEITDFNLNKLIQNDEIRIQLKTTHGNMISIIGGSGCYSSPRNKSSNFDEVEIAIFDENDDWILPSKIVPLLEKYNFPLGDYEYETDENFRNAVISYVPIFVVIEMLLKL